MTKIVLLVEGQTEKIALPPFFRRWLDPRMQAPVEIAAVAFKGAGDYLRHYSQRAQRELGSGTCSGVIGLLDLYGSGLDYPNGLGALERHAWAKTRLEEQVGHDRFRQHLAIHETEAWLLSEPGIFPPEVREELPQSAPETVNFEDPPSKLLRRIYWNRLHRKYGKILDGKSLFTELDAGQSASRCPHLQALLSDLLELARRAV